MIQIKVATLYLAENDTMFRCFTSYRAWVVLALATVLGGYLVIWHGAHVAAALPLLVILACPLMHIFMHGGHGHHHGNEMKEQIPTTSSLNPPQPPIKGE